MIRRCPAVLAGLLVLLAFAPPALAQGGRSEINGTVVDCRKAVLPGVTVTAVNQDTGLERSIVSGGEGKFTHTDTLTRYLHHQSGAAGVSSSRT